MSSLHEFLAENLVQHKTRVKTLQRLSRGVSHLLLQAKAEARHHWPYSCTVNQDALNPQYETNPTPQPPDATSEYKPPFSISTQAMICASVDQILRRNRDHRFLNIDQTKQLRDAQIEVEMAVLAELKSRVGQGIMLASSTYGKDDVFTASWLLEMYSGQVDWKDKQDHWATDIKEKLVSLIAGSILNNNQVIDYERCLFKKNANEAGAHSLPLLKVLSALQIIKSDETLHKYWPAHQESVETSIEQAGSWLEKNLHRQMSFYRFKDFRFDAAELIFCLKGAIETKALSKHEPILDNVLDTVREAQQRSVYWRPYRPMLATSQGGVLLPLSIEVAVSLLDVLLQTEKFSKYSSTLEEYFTWLFNQRIEPPHQGDEEPRWVGWHSENSYEAHVIHVWDSALVGSFLTNLLEAVDINFQTQVTAAGGFAIETPDSIKNSLSEIAAPDMRLSPNSIERLTKAYLPEADGRPQRFSLLVFGPPGSAKTTLAKALAKSANWPLIYLSPSNFITSGEAGIEQQAKAIFDALLIMRDKVIFFDEIDRLILDRDSPAYSEQADMFQFMTPSMLTKFADLREAERSVFVIATNYEDHIDKAIKRKGRIDELFLWLPMDLDSRTGQLEKLIESEFLPQEPNPRPSWSADLEAKLRSFAKQTVLSTFPELQTCFKSAGKKPDTVDLEEFRREYVEQISSLSKEKIAVPDLSVEAYEKRTSIDRQHPELEKYVQRPYEEYASILILQGESDVPEAEKRFTELQKRWCEQSRDQYERTWPKIKDRAVKYGLSAWVISEVSEDAKRLKSPKDVQPKSSASKGAAAAKKSRRPKS